MKTSALIPIVLIIIGGIFILAGKDGKSPVTLIKETLATK